MPVQIIRFFLIFFFFASASFGFEPQENEIYRIPVKFGEEQYDLLVRFVDVMEQPQPEISHPGRSHEQYKLEVLKFYSSNIWEYYNYFQKSVNYLSGKNFFQPDPFKVIKINDQTLINAVYQSNAIQQKSDSSRNISQVLTPVDSWHSPAFSYIVERADSGFERVLYLTKSVENIIEKTIVNFEKLFHKIGFESAKAAVDGGLELLKIAKDMELHLTLYDMLAFFAEEFRQTDDSQSESHFLKFLSKIVKNTKFKMPELINLEFYEEISSYTIPNFSFGFPNVNFFTPDINFSIADLRIKPNFSSAFKKLDSLVNKMAQVRTKLITLALEKYQSDYSNINSGMSAWSPEKKLSKYFEIIRVYEDLKKIHDLELKSESLAKNIANQIENTPPQIKARIKLALIGGIKSGAIHKASGGHLNSEKLATIVDTAKKNSKFIKNSVLALDKAHTLYSKVSSFKYPKNWYSAIKDGSGVFADFISSYRTGKSTISGNREMIRILLGFVR